MNDGGDQPAAAGPWRFLELAVLPLMALLGAALNFHPVAIGWDPAEYVWAVRANLLPHTPYLGYHLIGELLSLVMPVALGLSLVSTAAFVGAALLLPRVLRHCGGTGPTPFFATAFFLSFPICMRQAGIQEVYAVLVCFLLLSLWSLTGEGRYRFLVGGLAITATAVVHFGALLVLPCFLYWILFPTGDERLNRGQRLALWLSPGLLLGPIALQAIWRLFEPYAGRGLEFPEYFQGIGLWVKADTPGAWLAGFAKEARTFFGPLVVGVPPIVGAFTALGLLVSLRRPWMVLFPWCAFALVYATFEAGVGRNVDLGLYMAYLALPTAVFAGHGLAAAVRWTGVVFGRLVPARRAERVATRAALGGLFFLFGFNLWGSRLTYPGEELRAFDSLPAVQASRWIEGHLDPGVIVVEPLGIDNANLLPSLHLRRPILWFRGSYRLMEPYGKWAPIHPAFFAELTTERLCELIADGHVIVAMDRALEGMYPGVRLEPWFDGGEQPPFELYRVVVP